VLRGVHGEFGFCLLQKNPGVVVADYFPQTAQKEA
jgi:hypothetical protein